MFILILSCEGNIRKKPTRLRYVYVKDELLEIHGFTVWVPDPSYGREGISEQIPGLVTCVNTHLHYCTSLQPNLVFYFYFLFYYFRKAYRLLQTFK